MLREGDGDLTRFAQFTCMLASCKMILNMTKADRKKLLKQHSKMVWSKRTCTLTGREVQIQNLKGGVEGVVPMESALGIRLVTGVEARQRDRQGGVVLVMTSNMRYYFASAVAAAGPASSVQASSGSQTSSAMLDWLSDLQRHASKAQMGATIGSGERYDTLFSGDTKENGTDEKEEDEKRKKKGSKIFGISGKAGPTSSAGTQEKKNINPLLDPNLRGRLASIATGPPHPKQRGPVASLAIRPALYDLKNAASLA